MIGASILVVVPARGGSKRMPGKNIAGLGGMPLIAHTARFLETEGLLENSIVSTDDEAIAEVARGAGLNVPFMRPAELGSDTATTHSVVVHALKQHEEKVGSMPDLVVVAQPTSPFRRRRLARDAIKLLNDAPSAASVVTMAKLHVPQSYVFNQGSDGTMERAVNNNASDAAYVPTGSLYLTRAQALLEQNTIYAEPVLKIDVSGRDVIDIDTPEDFALAQAMLGAPAET